EISHGAVSQQIYDRLAVQRPTVYEVREDCQRLAAWILCRRTRCVTRQQKIRTRAIVVGKKSVTANFHLVEIDSSNQLVTPVSHVANFQYRLEPDLALNAEVV